jgi:hypothetical protein
MSLFTAHLIFKKVKPTLLEALLISIVMTAVYKTDSLTHI